MKGFFKDRSELQRFALALTCNIMNASGNLKEPVKPEDFYLESGKTGIEKAEENKEFLKRSAERFGKK